MAIQKILRMGADDVEEFSPIDASTGVGDAGKPIAADASGLLNSSFLPPGIGADTAVIVASEALSAGNFVNIWNDAGAFKVRKADASTTGKQADGFVLSAVASGANATVYPPGSANNQLSGLTPVKHYLSTTTPGGVQTTVPTTAGHIIQELGKPSSATSMVFSPKMVIKRG